LIFLAGLLLGIAVAATGCAGPGYYFQAVGGHLKLMHARQKVADLLADPGTDPELVRRLGKARDLLAFADTRLGLPADDSYSTYVRTGRSAVVWNVVATPEFSLEPRRWCFPVAGCVPYRGYFNLGKAQQFAQKLRRKELDVSVRGASAYSTLGWFSDPLLDTMLSTDDLHLAATLFHELAHQRLYVKGDTAFNEAYATFVGQQGVRDYLASIGKPGQLAGWQTRIEAQAAFSNLQSDTRAKLSKLYAGNTTPQDKRAAKRRIFDAMRENYRQLVRDEWHGHDYFGSWFARTVNNADLALFADYHEGICAFDRLYQAAHADYQEFHSLAARQANKPFDGRRQWLESACSTAAPGIASGSDM